MNADAFVTIMSNIIDVLGGLPSSLAATTKQLDERRVALARRCRDVEQHIPGVHLTLNTAGVQCAALGTVDDVPYTTYGSPFAPFLITLGEILQAAQYDRIAQHIRVVDAYTTLIECLEQRLEAFVHVATHLAPEHRPCVHFLAMALGEVRDDAKLGALLCADTPFDDTQLIEHCNAHPQLLPPALLLSMLRERHTSLDEQKVFVHLGANAHGHTTVPEQLRETVSAFWDMSTDFFIWRVDPFAHDTAPKEWFWPFRHLDNAQVPDRRAIVGPLSLTSRDEVVVHYAYVPYEASRQYNDDSEDSLWFSVTDSNSFVAVVADGASQSALGGIASNVLCSMVMRYTEAHPTRFIEKDFAHICRLARSEAQSEIAQTLAQLKHSNVDDYIIRLLHERNTVGGSQAVFAIVQKIGNTIHCISAGNVRVIIPGYLERDSPLFASDSARFASLPESGLIGDIHYNSFTLKSDSFAITMHSDALESHADRLAAHGSLDIDTLMAAAQRDDTTYITFRYPAVAQ